MILPRPLCRKAGSAARAMDTKLSRFTRTMASQVSHGASASPHNAESRHCSPARHLSEGPQYLVYRDLRSVFCPKIRHYGQHLGVRAL